MLPFRQAILRPRQKWQASVGSLPPSRWRGHLLGREPTRRFELGALVLLFERGRAVWNGLVLERTLSVATNPVLFLCWVKNGEKKRVRNSLPQRTNVNTKVVLIRVSAAQALTSQVRVDIPCRSASRGKVLTFMMAMPPPNV